MPFNNNVQWSLSLELLPQQRTRIRGLVPVLLGVEGLLAWSHLSLSVAVTIWLSWGTLPSAEIHVSFSLKPETHSESPGEAEFMSVQLDSFHWLPGLNQTCFY